MEKSIQGGEVPPRLEVKCSHLRSSHPRSSSEVYKQTNHSKITNIILLYFKKMNELNSTETYSNLNAIPLSDQPKFRLNEINKIKGYFNSEIQERKTMSKKPSKYIAAFDYIDKTMIVLSEAIGGISIISFTSVIGIPAGLASASFTLVFSLTTGIIQILLK